jgi:hypothetical protein
MVNQEILELIREKRKKQIRIGILFDDLKLISSKDSNEFLDYLEMQNKKISQINDLLDDIKVIYEKIIASPDTSPELIKLYNSLVDAEEFEDYEECKKLILKINSYVK